MQNEVISRLPVGWQDLFHRLCKSAEVAELWYMDAVHSGYGHRPEWHTLLRSLQVQDPYIMDEQLLFKPRFSLLPMALQERFLTFLMKESWLISDRDLLRFCTAVRGSIPANEQNVVDYQLSVISGLIQDYGAVDKQPSDNNVEMIAEMISDVEINKRSHTYSNNEPADPDNDVIIIDEDEAEPAAKRQKLDNPGGTTVTQVGDQTSFGTSLREFSADMPRTPEATFRMDPNIEERVKEMDATMETDDQGQGQSEMQGVGQGQSNVGAGQGQSEKVEGAGGDAGNGRAEEIREMIDKLKETLQSGEEAGVSDLLSEVSKLSVTDLEWFCRRIDFVDMTDDSTELMCKHMCSLAELLSYTSVVCMLKYVVFAKVVLLSQTPSRKLSGAITLVVEKFPKQLIDSVIIPCVVQEDISSFQAELLSRLIKGELSSNTRSYLVQKLFSSSIIVSENKLPLFQTLFESLFDADESVMNRVVDSFDHASEKFAKNLKFGKLLLAIVNKHGELLVGDSKIRFASVVDRHGTFLKKSVKNALNKLK